MAWIILGALGVGICLGLLGSGGSILTVPVLTYLVGQDEKIAIAGSLGIVGAISLVAGIPYALRRQVCYRSVAWFGGPGMAGAYLGAGLSQFVTGSIQLIVFSALMLLAAVLMLRPVQEQPIEGRPAHPVFKIALEGLLVGTITGFVGVGGGFLIVPALALLVRLPMRLAVGTSLLIIALKSFAGFWKYLDVLDNQGLQLDWSVLYIFAGVGVVGSLIGNQINGRFDAQTLRRAFAVFLLIVGTFVVAKNLPF